MRVFIAGASGTVGRPLIERLICNRHEVAGMRRPAENPEWLQQLGAKPVHVDACDRAALWAALERTRPAVVFDGLTSLPKDPTDLAKAVAHWLSAFARWIDAPEPARVDAADALRQAGVDEVYSQTRLTGALNRRAKAVLVIAPRPLVWNHTSRRENFAR